MVDARIVNNFEIMRFVKDSYLIKMVSDIIAYVSDYLFP